MCSGELGAEGLGGGGRSPCCLVGPVLALGEWPPARQRVGSRPDRARRTRRSGRKRSSPRGSRKPPRRARRAVDLGAPAGRPPAASSRGHGPDAAAVVLLVVGRAHGARPGRRRRRAASGRGLADGVGALFGRRPLRGPRRLRRCSPSSASGGGPARGPARARREADEAGDERRSSRAEPAPLRVGRRARPARASPRLGLLHLAAGSPAARRLRSTTSRDAGGLLGAAIGAPLVVGGRHRRRRGDLRRARAARRAARARGADAPGRRRRRAAARGGWAARRARSPSCKPVDGATAEPTTRGRRAGAVDGRPVPDATSTADDTGARRRDRTADEPDARRRPDAAAPAAVVTLDDVEADSPVDVPVVDAGPGAQMAIDLGPAHRTGRLEAAADRPPEAQRRQGRRAPASSRRAARSSKRRCTSTASTRSSSA